MKRTLPTDSTERKNYPLFRGFLRYFPAAIAGAARISKIGNDRHNPGQEMHHARGKSNDHGDCIMRHLHDADELVSALERGEPVDRKALLDEANQLFWRAGAYSQELHEKYGDAPLAPGARLPEVKPPTGFVAGGDLLTAFKTMRAVEVDADGGAVKASPRICPTCNADLSIEPHKFTACVR